MKIDIKSLYSKDLFAAFFPGTEGIPASVWFFIQQFYIFAIPVFPGLSGSYRGFMNRA
jgi:hypothetical protein